MALIGFLQFLAAHKGLISLKQNKLFWITLKPTQKNFGTWSTEWQQK
jgi:hypothetical protein